MKTIVSYEESELLMLIAKGEEQAFDILYNDLYARLVYFARRYITEEADIQEIVNESFVKFWLRREKFDALAKIKSFLYITTRNALLNQIEKNKLAPVKTILDARPDDFIEHHPSSDLEVEDDPLYRKEAIRSDVLGALFREIENLPIKCREVVLLTYRDGLNTAEVAEKMGISVSNVTSQRSRAMQLLRVALVERFPVALASLYLQLLNEHITRS